MIEAEFVEQFYQLFQNLYNQDFNINNIDRHRGSYFWQRCKHQLISENQDILLYWRYIKWRSLSSYQLPAQARSRAMFAYDGKCPATCIA